MRFLEVIKRQMCDPRQNRGHVSNVLINRQSLEELIYHFESLDSWARAMDTKGDLHRQLHTTLEALYRDQRDGESLMMSIMDTLSPLIKERVKQESVNPVKIKGDWR